MRYNVPTLAVLVALALFFYVVPRIVMHSTERGRRRHRVLQEERARSPRPWWKRPDGLPLVLFVAAVWIYLVWDLQRRHYGRESIFADWMTVPLFVTIAVSAQFLWRFTRWLGRRS